MAAAKEPLTLKSVPLGGAKNQQGECVFPFPRAAPWVVVAAPRKSTLQMNVRVSQKNKKKNHFDRFGRRNR